jgi:hypothetical protein
VKQREDLLSVNLLRFVKTEPHLVLGILSQVIQAAHLKLEFAGLAEFTETCPKRNQVRARDGYGEMHCLDRKIVDTKSYVRCQPANLRVEASYVRASKASRRHLPIFVQTKAERILIRPINQMY